MNRRKFLTISASGLIAGSLIGLPELSFALAPTDKRLLVIILRGGMDGLAAVPPIGDSNYKKQRKKLTLDKTLRLDGFFGLHPSLKSFHALYSKKELAIFHAIASPYRKRSHFDGQNLLENGTNIPNGAKDGWLNRTLSYLPKSKNSQGLAIGQNIPLILYGQQPVASWTPSTRGLPNENLLNQIELMYDNDPIFHNALEQGLAIHEIANEAMADMQKDKKKKHSNTKMLIEAASRLLIDDNGARIATIEIDGWDTHAKQGSISGGLANNFKKLSEGIADFRKSLSPIWDKTAVIIVTEFGRTVAENGTGGTDHGTATTAFLMGGAVNGGKIHTNWPGLAKNELYQNRDLMPTSDIRQLFKAVLHNHMGISSTALNNVIFPKSTQARMFNKLIHQ